MMFFYYISKGRFIFLRCLFICIFLSQVSCFSNFQELREQRDKAETDLEAICKNIPIRSDFTEVDSEKTLHIRKVVIFTNYKSDATCKAVGEHFRNYFIGESWDSNRMQVRQSRGGMKTLDFDIRNDEYLISV